MTSKLDLYDAVYEARKRHGWSMQDVATRLDVPRTRLSELVNGTTPPGAVLLGRLERLSDVCSLDLSVLLELAERARLSWCKRQEKAARVWFDLQRKKLALEKRSRAGGRR